MNSKKEIENGSKKQNGGPRRLPVAEYGGKLYFVDERLGEMRNIRDPFDSIPLGSVKGARLVELEELPKPDIQRERP